MTKATNMIDAGLRTKIAVTGVSLTYTEAGAAGQTVNGLEMKRKSRGDADYQADFTFLLSDISVDEEGWRGATVTGSDSKVYRIVDRKLTPGSVTFTGHRALRRS